MRIALVHNLPAGGALRTVSAHLAHLDADVTEVCLATATPATATARIVPFAPRGPRVRSALRPPLRHTDLAELILAWRRATALVDSLGADVVLAHPCRFLQAPPVLIRASAPSVYFCHEPRRIDYEPGLRASRRSATRTPYAPLHAAERALDRRGVASADRLATNSHYTAGRIDEAYGRSATVIPMGVGDRFVPGAAPVSGHLLSVGTLIPGKGHDVAIQAAALAATQRRLVVVTPRPGPAEHARLSALAAELGVTLDVRVGIADDELLGLYRGAYATVQMGSGEPLGLASMEAQACGSPVIVAAEGGLPETIREGISGWAVAREAAPVAARLDALADPATHDRVAHAAAAWGATLTWQRSAAALQEILRATAVAA